MGKSPAFQFYPADWRKDPALQSCSIAARGLWIEMMCIMHESPKYGHLLVNQKVNLEVNLHRLVGLTFEETKGLLEELESHDVFARNENGVIFSKRMVRDEELREVRRNAGSKGGNPNLVKQKVKPEVNQKVNHASNQNSTPSSSSSSSPSGVNTPCKSPKGDASSNGYTKEFLEWWDSYPKKVGKDAAFRKWKSRKRAGTLPDVEALKKAVNDQRTSKSWKDGFVPNPETWLNQGRWMDDTDAPSDPKPPEGPPGWQDVAAKVIDEKYPGHRYRGEILAGPWHKAPSYLQDDIQKELAK